MKKLLCINLIILLLLTGCNGTSPQNSEQLTELSDIAYELHTLDEDGISLKTAGTEPNSVTKAVTWVANELVLNAQQTYKSQISTVDVDLLLTNGTVTYKIPGFWDGDNVWRVRFVCPTAGNWSYETVCSEPSDAGLHGIKGTLTCTEYTGNLAIYQHGFVKTSAGKQYFTYEDGTPFFYLGDTHWNLGAETAELVTKMADQRVKQGFTVVQSEPAGSRFNFLDGVTKSDMEGFALFDELVQIIAEHGLVHANASFFFPVDMQMLVNKYGFDKSKPLGSLTANGKDYLFYDLSDKTKELLDDFCRYWVARYSAYPVMWTLGQEVDKDFYWAADPGRSWSRYNNPYKYVAEYIHQYDPYSHPLTAHMEGVDVTTASDSVFRNVEGHSWWAVQWGQTFDQSLNFSWLEDFYKNNQGKPEVLYESKYCYLWTKNYGARVQGWAAMLSGTCGYGWGGNDTWSYQNPYDDTTESFDGVDVITPQDKQNATYEDSLAYPSSYQVGYMRAFFEKIVGDWTDLVPRFGDKAYLNRPFGSYGACASTEDNTKIVCYFYQTTDTQLLEKPNADEKTKALTGTLGQLEAGGKYGYVWFDPVDGKTIANGSFTADENGQWAIGEKADRDMVLFVYKK